MGAGAEVRQLFSTASVIVLAASLVGLVRGVVGVAVLRGERVR